jgi:hypothetical protein
MSPSLTLKLHDFFQHFSGDLIYHHEEQILCYLGEQNLSKPPVSVVKFMIFLHYIGHLRTMNMPQYQKFQQLMLNLIQ